MMDTVRFMENFRAESKETVVLTYRKHEVKNGNKLPLFFPHLY